MADDEGGGMGTATGARDAAAPRTDGAPQFADLRLLDTVGHMSHYAAREHGTGRAVTLKVVDADAPDFVVEGLDREAEYLARLGSHPHIVTLYQRTTLADRRPALVLEACPSST